MSNPLPDPVFLNRHTPPGIFTLTMLAGVASLAMNMFLPSLPGMATYFGVPYATMQLSVSLYMAVSAVLQIVLGPLSDRYGRRRVLLASLAVFLLASVGTILAPTAEVFLACRMAQAVVVAGMVLSRAVVRDMVADARAASMIGYITMGMSLMPMIGPIIGGWLDEAFGWQASFGLLLALGVAVYALAWADLGETSRPTGLTLIGQIRQYPDLLASPRFWGYAMAAAFTSGCFFAYLGGAPYVGATVFGLSPSHIGALFALTALGYAAGNFAAGRYSVRMGMNRMILLGAVVITFGMGLLLILTLLGLSNAVTFFGLTFFMGMGNGMSLPNANAGILSVRPKLAGTASGLGGAIMIGGGAGLAALAGWLLHPGATELPLVWLMFLSALGSLASILLVIRRAKRIGLPS